MKKKNYFSIFTYFEKRRKLSLIITILLAVFIFVMSSFEFPVMPIGPPSVLSILYHLGVFFLFSLFLFISFVRGKKTKFLPSLFLIAIAYGILDEFHQFFVPGRYCSLLDVLWDGMGILFSFMIYYISVRYRK